MLSEQYILSCAIRDRHGYNSINDYLDRDDLSPVSKRILDSIGKYYDRDSECNRVNHNLLIEQIKQEINNEKQSSQLTEVIEDVMGLDISAKNVSALIMEQKRRALGMRLAEALINGDHDDDLFSEYMKIVESDSIDQALGDEFSDVNFDELVSVLDNESKIKVYPKSLNDRLDGGLVRGDAVLIAGRPEAMKTGLAVTNAAGMAYRGHKVLYLSNEEPVQRIIVRCISCLTGRTKSEILADPEETMRLARQRGYGNLVFAYPVNTLQHLRALVKKHKPDVFILDQIRSLRVKADNRTGQLEAAGIAVRSVAGENNAAVISITQAGESAEGKLRLNMSDIDSSKTGLQGAVDVMVMIGVDANFDAADSRTLSLPKNKSGGNHDSWAVKVNKQLSRYYDV
jgi:replicative DNA helicase